MKALRLLILLLIISVTAQAQLIQKPIIKTKPFRCAIAWNPNIGSELQIKNSRFTISPEYTYTLRTREPIGFESSAHVLSKGFSFLTDVRFYFDKNLEYPRGHFLSVHAGYTYSFIERQDYYDIQGYLYTASTTIKYPEFNIAIGKQIILFNRLSLDLVVGIQQRIKPYRSLHIIQSYDHRELIGTDIGGYKNDSPTLPFCQFNIGVLLFNRENK